jgi:hypothetical protein
VARDTRASSCRSTLGSVCLVRCRVQHSRRCVQRQNKQEKPVRAAGCDSDNELSDISDLDTPELELEVPGTGQAQTPAAEMTVASATSKTAAAVARQPARAVLHGEGTGNQATAAPPPPHRVQQQVQAARAPHHASTPCAGAATSRPLQTCAPQQSLLGGEGIDWMLGPDPVNPMEFSRLFASDDEVRAVSRMRVCDAMWQMTALS